MSWVVDQDEFAEVELVGESLPFGLVQDAFVVVVSGSKVCVRMLTLCSVWVCVVCVCVRRCQPVTPMVYTHVPVTIPLLLLYAFLDLNI